MIRRQIKGGSCQTYGLLVCCETRPAPPLLWVPGVVSAVQLVVDPVTDVGPGRVFLPRELQTEHVSHLVQMVQHLRTQKNLAFRKYPEQNCGRYLCGFAFTWSSISRVCAADRQKRARASVIGVAGKPTTTTPIFLSSISRAKALITVVKREATISFYSLKSTHGSNDCFVQFSAGFLLLNDIKFNQKCNYFGFAKHYIFRDIFMPSLTFLLLICA